MNRKFLESIKKMLIIKISIVLFALKIYTIKRMKFGDSKIVEYFFDDFSLKILILITYLFLFY